MKSFIGALLVSVVLASCVPAADVPPVNAVTPTRSLDALLEMLVSDPESPQYNPDSAAYDQFPEVVEQLGRIGINVASHLAHAISFPRRDSYLAAQALLKMPPDVIGTTIPVLIDNLDSLQPDARVYSLVLLGEAGTPASCALGEIAPLLWDPDPSVRSAAAYAVEQITGQDLLAAVYEVEVTPLFLADAIYPDTPEGEVVEKARDWWNEEGIKVDWHPAYGICDP